MCKRDIFVDETLYACKFQFTDVSFV